MYYECLKCLLWENCQELSLNTKCNVTKIICQDHLKPLPFPESSLAINQSSSECGLFAISSFLHPNCAQILKSRLYFQNHTSLFFFFLIWFFAALTLSVHSSVSEIYFWLLGQANMLIIFLSPHNCSHNLHPYHFTMGNTLFQIKSFVPCLFLPSSFFNALYSIAPCSLPLLCFVFTFF